MVIVVFRSRLRDDADQEAYAATSRRMRELVQHHPGFISIENFTSEDGEELSLELFESEESVAAWRAHPEHRAAQRRGREEFYETFRTMRSVLVDERSFERGQGTVPAG